jgi:hypothetical protein
MDELIESDEGFLLQVDQIKQEKLRSIELAT